MPNAPAGVVSTPLNDREIYPDSSRMIVSAPLNNERSNSTGELKVGGIQFDLSLPNAEC